MISGLIIDKSISMLEKLFQLKTAGTNVRQEMLGGLTTFMTMAYICFVQPAVMGAAGMDPGAVLLATCLASAAATVMMGLYARYPIALAPGMGQNFFFTYTVVLTLGVPWQTALGIVFLAGAVFMILSLFGFREKVIDSIPDALKSAIAAGIGLMITLIGLEWGGLVVDDPALLVTLGDLGEPVALLTLFGLFVTAILLVKRIRGAMLIGIIVTTGAGIVFDMIPFHGIVSTPPAISGTFMQLDLAGAFRWDLLAVVFTFFILDLFDTVGTLVGVASEAGFMKNGKLPRARQALLSDATGSVIGAVLGTSTVTSYVESASGIASGARTGLANMFTALLFILVIFFYPVVQMIGGGIELADGMRYYPAIAPVLILVGLYMMKGISRIPWKDFSESIPAFITLIIIPFSFRITEGIAFGFIAYTVLKFFEGKWREVPLMMWLFAIIFALRYIYMAMVGFE